MSHKIFRDMLKPKAQLSRNGFDRSYLHNFTAKIGELLPIMSVETVPGSHYEINVSDMMRTIPMNQAAFIRASQHFEFYFVPYKQLWHRWDDFFTKRSSPTSTSLSFAVPSVAPNAPIATILNQFKTTARLNENLRITSQQVGDIGEAIGEGCTKIWNLLGYGSCKKYVDIPNGDATVGSYPADIPDFLSERNVNLFRAAAYQKIFYDFYRQPFYDLPYDGCQYAFNLDDSNLSTGEVSSTLSGGTIDDRAYYRFARLFQLHYRQWKKDLFTGVLPNTQFGAVATVTTGSSSDTVPVSLDVVTNLASRRVDIQLEGAYLAAQAADGLEQGDHPNSQFLVQGVNPGDPDYIDGLLTVDQEHPITLGNKFVTIGDYDNVPVISSDTELSSAQLYSGQASGTATGNIQTGGTGSFNVLSLVQAQALQRWREITMRSGFRATEQYEGHFGVKPIFTDKDKCVFIDSVSSPLQVNTVQNTNAGAYIGEENIPLGDLAANGTSVCSSDKVIKFDCKDFGVLMCVYSMLPEATYQHEGVDLMNVKVYPDDFFVPEFENIGLQIVPMSLFKLGENNGANGYAAHYYEYKIGLDVQSDEFMKSETAVDTEGTDTVYRAGAFYGWSPSRQISLDVSQSGTVSPALFARDLYVSPMYFANIFSRLPYYGVKYTGNMGVDFITPYSAQLSIGDSKQDSFVHQCYFDIKCVQPMSVLGLPRY